MAKKMRTMRTFARTASKSMEKKLVENAKKIMKDPYLTIPDYEDNYSKKVIGKIKKSIDKVKKYQDDTKKLEKLANKQGLEGAIAGTMLIAHSEKAPYLGVFKYPTGDITYAQRGRADKEKLIAVQHFDNPIFRLLSIKDIALKKKLHVYSWDDGFYSSGVDPNPPDGFIDFVIKKTGLKRKNDVVYCGDIKPDQILDKKTHTSFYIRLFWKSAKITYGICQNCASKKENTLFNISKYLIQTDMSDDFDIEVIGSVLKKVNEKNEGETVFVSDYISGKISDYEFISKNIAEKEKNLRDSGDKVFILDGESFGLNVDDFIGKLDPNKFEKQGLRIILDMVQGPVVFDDATPNKVFEKYWDKYGKDTINSIINNDEMAEKFISLDDNPSDILQLVFKYKDSQAILAQLPRYDKLPPLAMFIDNVARTYKTLGDKEALVEIKKRPDDTKSKSVAYAFLSFFEKAKDKKWQFSKVEIEYGEYLKDYVKKLLTCEPNEYHNALKEVLINSGSSDDIDKYIL